MSRLRLLAKYLLGKDLYLRADVRLDMEMYGRGYAAWALPKDYVRRNSVVYSFGIGEDVSFDLTLIEAVGCQIHAFDPTPKSLAWVDREVREPRFIVHPWALGPKVGSMQLWLPSAPEHVSASCRPSDERSEESFVAECKDLPTIMTLLGHTHVDVLKMDIEGAEYEVLSSLTADSTIKKVRCLLVEFHHWMGGFHQQETLDAIEALRGEGFLILWVSETGHELLFGRPDLAALTS